MEHPKLERIKDLKVGDALVCIQNHVSSEVNKGDIVYVSTIMTETLTETLNADFWAVIDVSGICYETFLDSRYYIRKKK